MYSKQNQMNLSKRIFNIIIKYLEIYNYKKFI